MVIVLFFYTVKSTTLDYPQLLAIMVDYKGLEEFLSKIW